MTLLWRSTRLRVSSQARERVRQRDGEGWGRDGGKDTYPHPLPFSPPCAWRTDAKPIRAWSFRFPKLQGNETKGDKLRYPTITFIRLMLGNVKCPFYGPSRTNYPPKSSCFTKFPAVENWKKRRPINPARYQYLRRLGEINDSWEDHSCHRIC